MSLLAALLLSLAPATCDSAAIEQRVGQFVSAINGGRLADVDALWAREPAFQWYSTRTPGARLGRAAHDRGTLRSYFRARMRHHERLRIVSLGARYDAARNLGHFDGKLVRRADDTKPRRLDFKGALDCSGAQPLFIVWGM